MIGRILRGLRSGTRKLASNDPGVTSPATIELHSPDFASNTTMAAAYRGPKSIMPPLVWTNVPAETKELVLVVEDVDVPLPAPLVHALVYAISPQTTDLGRGVIPRVSFRTRGVPGAPALGKSAGVAPGFLPVTPIPEHGPHRYVFQLFALDTMLAPFPRTPSKKRLVAAIRGHVIAHGTTVGLAEA